MRQKLIEIRDKCTCITAIAIQTCGDNVSEQAFFDRGGWGEDSIILIKCNGECEANYDPFKWGGNRTMFEAHRYIEQHFSELPDYAVVDVEFILGETERPKTTEVFPIDAEL